MVLIFQKFGMTCLLHLLKLACFYIVDVTLDRNTLWNEM